MKFATLTLSSLAFLLSAIIGVASLRIFSTTSNLARTAKTIETSLSNQEARITDLESRAHFLIEAVNERKGLDQRIKNIDDELNDKLDKEPFEAILDRVRDDEKDVANVEKSLAGEKLFLLRERVKLLDDEIGNFVPSNDLSGGTINERLANIEGRLQKVENRLQVQPE